MLSRALEQTAFMHDKCMAALRVHAAQAPVLLVELWGAALWPLTR
jgi:hypothetical protein